MKSTLRSLIGAASLALAMGTAQAQQLPIYSYFSNNHSPEEGTHDYEAFDKAYMMLDSANAFRTAFGVTTIDGETYLTARIRPEFKLGKKMGLGIDIPIQYNLSSGGFRKEEYQYGSGLARAVRYFRIGTWKKTPLFVRFGDISNMSLGYGGLVNNYTNSVSFERRKVGAHYDLRFKNIIGVEGIYSDVEATSVNALMLRPYVRPFANKEIPILNTFEVGFTYISDHDNTKTQINDSTSVAKVFVKDGLKASGFDAGLRLFNTNFLNLSAYAQYNFIGKVNSDSLNRYINTLASDDVGKNYAGGKGLSIGVNARMCIAAEMLQMDVRLERQWYSDYYRPQFFDMSYEMNKDAKILGLVSAVGTQGTYGVLSAIINHKVRITGGLLMPDKISETSPALVQLSLDAIEPVKNLIVTASYLKGNLSTLDDAFKLDDRSLAKAKAIYTYKFLSIGGEYYWTFTKTESGTFEPTSFFTPYFGLNIPLGKDK